MSEPAGASQACIFCRIAAGQAPASVVYRDEHTMAFMDIQPASRGHVLVIPVRHAETLWELEEAEAGRLFGVATRIARWIRDALQPLGLNVLQSNGQAAGQVVFHVHLHLIPRFGGEEGLRFRLRAPDSPVPTREELEELARQIRRAGGLP